MSYKDRRDVAIANDYLGGHMACRKCGQQTDIEMLSNLGAQCGACFTAYTREINPPTIPRTLEQKRAIAERARHVMANKAGGIGYGDARATARRLRELEASGQRLTPGQQWVLKCCEAKTGIGWHEVAA
jgi:hypothetical protein